jgi:hypothetical protein
MRHPVLLLAFLIAPFVHANCPTPILTEKAAVSTASNPLSMATADFNHDGKQDVVVASTSSTVQVHFGNGDGTFGAGVPYASGGTDVVGVAAGDMNGDGWADLVMANYTTNNISIRLNNQDGTFGAANTYPANGNSPTQLLLADFDSDGHMDIAVLCIDSVQIRWGSANGALDGINQYSLLIFTNNVTYLPTGIALGDFDGDGKFDVGAVASAMNAETSGHYAAFRYAGSRTFNGYGGSIVNMTTTNKVTAGDWNGDGKDDLAVTNGSNTVAILTENTSAPTIGFSTLRSTVTPDPEAITRADVNGDGYLDLLVSSRNGSTFAVLLGNADGSFQSPFYQSLSAGFTHMYGILSADWNNDGRSDVALLEGSLNKFYPFLNGCTARSVTMSLGSSANPSLYGDAVTITATLVTSDGDTPTGTVTFFEGATNLGTATVSGTTATISVSNFTLGAHQLTASYSGDATYSAAATRHAFEQDVIRRPYSAPRSFNAVGDPTVFVINMSWVGSADVDHYEVWRLAGGGWSLLNTTTSESYSDLSVSASQVYAYKVRGIGIGVAPTDFSTPDSATTYVFAATSIAAGRVIQAVDLTDLRTVINSFRNNAGLGAMSWTDAVPTGVTVKAVHMNELRTALNAARSAAGMPALTFSAPVLTPGTSVVRATDWQELRSGVN